MGKVSVWCYKITCQIECNLLFVRIVLAIIKRPVANWHNYDFSSSSLHLASPDSHLPLRISHFPALSWLPQATGNCHCQCHMMAGQSLVYFMASRRLKFFAFMTHWQCGPNECWCLSLSLIKLAPRRWPHLVAVSIPFRSHLRLVQLQSVLGHSINVRKYLIYVVI